MPWVGAARLLSDHRRLPARIGHGKPREAGGGWHHLDGGGGGSVDGGDGGDGGAAFGHGELAFGGRRVGDDPEGVARKVVGRVEGVHEARLPAVEDVLMVVVEEEDARALADDGRRAAQKLEQHRLAALDVHSVIEAGQRSGRQHVRLSEEPRIVGEHVAQVLEHHRTAAERGDTDTHAALGGAQHHRAEELEISHIFAPTLSHLFDLYTSGKRVDAHHCPVEVPDHRFEAAVEPLVHQRRHVHAQKPRVLSRKVATR